MIRINNEQEAELRRLIRDGFRSKSKLHNIEAFLDGLKTPVKFMEKLERF